MPQKPLRLLLPHPLKNFIRRQRDFGWGVAFELGIGSARDAICGPYYIVLWFDLFYHNWKRDVGPEGALSVTWNTLKGMFRDAWKYREGHHIPWHRDRFNRYCWHCHRQYERNLWRRCPTHIAMRDRILLVIGKGKFPYDR